MTGNKAPIIDLHLLRLPGRLLRWVPWVAYGGAGVGYLSGLSTPYLTLFSLLLLTLTYGAGSRSLLSVYDGPW